MASVAKRKYVYKGEVREGGWAVRYKDKGGAHRSREFAMKKDADAYRRKVENELEAGAHVAPSQSRTIADVGAEYLERIERRHQTGETGLAYLISSRRHVALITQLIGSVKLVDLTWQQVERFTDELRALRSAKTGRPYKNGTLRAVLASFTALVGHGVRRGYAARNPVREARPEIGAFPVAGIATFSADQVRTLFATLEAGVSGSTPFDRKRLRAMIYLAACCGLRKGEVLGLTAAAFDFERGAINVRQSLTDWDTLKAPKTISGVRTVPMPSIVASAVLAFMQVARPDKRGLIFRTKSGAKIGARDFRNTWCALLLRAGLGPIRDGEWYHFHALRHFAGSAWLSGGIPLADVSKLLGHAHPQITARVYSHAIVEPMFRASALEAIATAMLGPPDAQGLRIAA